MSMNWRIFVDMNAAKKNAPVEDWGDTRMNGSHRSFTYRRSDSPVGLDIEMHTLINPEVVGGEFVEHKGVRPELPPAFADIVPIIRVTAVGSPPAGTRIKEGLYLLDDHTVADVRKNGEKFKIELTARDCASAWKLYLAMLRGDETIRLQ